MGRVALSASAPRAPVLPSLLLAAWLHHHQRRVAHFIPVRSCRPGLLAQSRWADSCVFICRSPRGPCVGAHLKGTYGSLLEGNFFYAAPLFLFDDNGKFTSVCPDTRLHSYTSACYILTIIRAAAAVVPGWECRRRSLSNVPHGMLTGPLSPMSNLHLAVPCYPFFRVWDPADHSKNRPHPQVGSASHVAHKEANTT